MSVRIQASQGLGSVGRIGGGQGSELPRKESRDRMARNKQVEVSVTLEQGDFSFCLNGVLLNIRVKDSLDHLAAASPENRPLGPSGQGEAAAPLPFPEAGNLLDAARLAEEVAHYRRASQEIYEGLGRLAKEINLSIQDLSLAEIIQSGTISPGERLDQVRSQVTEVLEMTEKATLNILNLVGHIQEDCLKVQEHLLHIANGTGDSQDADGPDSGKATDAQEFWSRLLSRGEAFDRRIHEFFEKSPARQKAFTPVRLPDVLQILLEFCSTEKVKPHLKSLQTQHETLFQVDETEQALAALTAEAPSEDGFYQLPVEKVLAILQETCTEARVKELFSKLLASAAKIFPVATLPLECPSTDDASGAGSEVLALWQEFLDALRQAAGSPAAGRSVAAAGREEILQDAARESLSTVKRISASLSRITEALAFQDLSGQRLLKVLSILRQLQVQVLTLLVAAGEKLKVGLERKGTSVSMGETSAQEQLNRILNPFPQDPDESRSAEDFAAPQQPLDQEAINELLTSLGF
uniref:Protein phosphatase CheZ n=1 Tax=Desulfobacca acetoxidans TaxID=60893 RepID=A0A7C3WIR2_9BACT